MTRPVDIDEDQYLLNGPRRLHAVPSALDAEVANGAPQNVSDVIEGALGRGIEPNTDLANARRLARDYGGHVLRNCPALGWLHYSGVKWQIDPTQAQRLAKEVTRRILDEITSHVDPTLAEKMARWAKTSQAAKSINAMLDLARSEPEIHTPRDAFDADPELLNVANRVVDLGTGEICHHDPDGLFMRVAGTGIDKSVVDCPLWLSFLERVLPDPALRSYIQRAVGYSLTGLTTEQVFFFLFGIGANGKTVFLEILLALLGDYGITAPASTIMGKRKDIPNDLARLAGARVVAVTETDEGMALNESRIKDVTGSDTISARFLHKEYFDFRPAFKLWLRGNHKPEIRGTDEGIWRRVHMISFTETIPVAERDGHLQDKLLAELPGILLWALEGTLASARRAQPSAECRRRCSGLSRRYGCAGPVHRRAVSHWEPYLRGALRVPVHRLFEVV